MLMAAAQAKRVRLSTNTFTLSGIKAPKPWQCSGLQIPRKPSDEPYESSRIPSASNTRFTVGLEATRRACLVQLG
jgi:hypothetical protein